jgi:phosphoglycerate kinase
VLAAGILDGVLIAIAVSVAELLVRVARPHDAVLGLVPGLGGLVMLENLRFDARETSRDDTQRRLFADELAALADLYVSDGFGVVHRKQASVYDVADALLGSVGGTFSWPFGPGLRDRRRMG